MPSVSVAEAKARLSEILDEVQGGEEVVITRRGLAIARLVAVKKTPKPLKPASRFRSTLPKSKVPSVQIIRRMRDEGF
jgi:prevent-host-death family protein